jgi:hypothetical protein
VGGRAGKEEIKGAHQWSEERQSVMSNKTIWTSSRHDLDGEPEKTDGLCGQAIKTIMCLVNQTRIFMNGRELKNKETCQTFQKE